MTTYSKTEEETPDVKELLELSTLYHQLITDLGEQWQLFLTPAMRHQAFKLVSAVGDQVKVKTLAQIVLKEVSRGDVK